ncbi:MAG: hypothetical protein NTV17_09565, partial [Burkholderiales bacterium]|nr:hypothetical protein [Burkholderiales bacterium]
PKRPRLSAVQFLKSTLSCDQHRSGMMRLLFCFVKSHQIFVWFGLTQRSVEGRPFQGLQLFCGAALWRNTVEIKLCSSAEPATISGFFQDCKSTCEKHLKTRLSRGRKG